MGASLADAFYSFLRAALGKDFGSVADLSKEFYERYPKGIVGATDLMVSAVGYGAKGDAGITDNSNSIADAIEDNPNRSIFLPAGNYFCNSATRHLIDQNRVSLVGDPAGLATQITYTNAAGGLDIGNGVTDIYENRLINIVLNGNGTATNLLRCRKMYEPYFNNLRVEIANGPLITFDGCGQADLDRVTLGTSTVGLEFLNTNGTIRGRLLNMYSLADAIKISGDATTISFDSSWFEAITNIINLNSAGSISLGDVKIRNSRFTSTLAAFRLVKATAATAINGQLVDFSDNGIFADNSIVPLVDFSSFPNNGGSFRFKMHDSLVYASSVVGPLVQVDATQNWWLFPVDMNDIKDAIGPLSVAKWMENPGAIGGVFPTPPVLTGAGTPEGNLAAFPGTQYKRMDGGAGTSLYIKETGTGTTGWVGK